MTPRFATRRLTLVFCIFLLMAAAVVAALFRIQVLEHERYLAEAERQHKKKVSLPARRGDIVDRAGVPLAVSAEGVNVFVEPDRVKDKQRVARLLASELDLSYSHLIRRISGTGSFAMIRKKVSPVAIRKLRESGLDGVGFIPSPKRYYPRNELAAQVIGYVGIDDTGLSGVELALDSHLCGTPGWLVVQRDARGRPYNSLDLPLRRQRNGYSVRLSIEAQFQEIVEHALRRAIEESGARNGCVVAVDPDNGEILALANYPTVNLNGDDGLTASDFLNRATNMPYEPGSTFKPFAMSALIQHGLVSLDDTVFCENGAYRIRSRIIRDVHHYGRLSARDIIAKSSNIGMAKLIQRIDEPDLYRTLRDFGFGAYTGDCFSGEDMGRLAPPSEWDRTTKTSLAFGYAVLATPLQMAMAYTALANGGILYEPLLVKEIFDEDGNTVCASSPARVRRVLPREVTWVIKKALAAVVDSGTGTAAAVPGFRVAGKTGTSMKADPGVGYGGNGYFSSFGGFFPADDPQVVMCIVINDPDFSHRWGGSSAAPVFGEVIRNTLLSNSRVIDRSRLGLPTATVRTAALDGRRPDEPDAADLRTPPVDTARPPEAAESGARRMPEVTGLTVREAVERLSALGLRTRLVGGTSVRYQYPPAGTPVADGELCTLTGVLESRLDNSLSMVSDKRQNPNQD